MWPQTELLPSVYSFELPGVISQAAEKGGPVGYPPCRKRWSTGRTILAPGILRGKRQLPGSDFHRTRKGLCSREEDHLGREGGADTAPQASAASSPGESVSRSPCRYLKLTTGHSTFLPQSCKDAGNSLQGTPQLISNLLSGKDRGQGVSLKMVRTSTGKIYTIL